MCIFECLVDFDVTNDIKSKIFVNTPQFQKVNVKMPNFILLENL